MKRIEAADFHDIAQVSSPRVAPDDDAVAFVRTIPDDAEEYEATVHVAPLGEGQPRRFTLAAGVDAEPRWSPSGDRLAFVSTRGADDDRTQLWVVPADGGEGRQVTEVVGGVGGVAWSPDGTRIAFIQQVSPADREADRDLAVPDEYDPEPPDPRVVDRTVYRSNEEFFDGRRGQVYIAHLTDDAVERVTTGEYDHTSLSWGDDSTLYFTEKRGDPDPDDAAEQTIVAYDATTGDREDVHTTTAWAETAITATADGRVAYLHVEDDRPSLRQTTLRVVAADTGAVSRPTADLDRTVALDPAPQWGPAEDSLYFVTPDEGADALWSVAWDGDDPERVVREAWASIDGAHVGEDVVGLVRSEWDHPGDVFVASRGGSEERRLTRVNAEYLDERAVSRPEEVRVEHDGHEIQGWLLTPPDFDPGARYPLAVEVHGGPHAMWTTSGTMWHEFQTLAARGYVVFWSNPRGSTGYGEAFSTAIERDWGAVTASDVLAGVDAVTDRAFVDEDQVFLTGGSFGGFMTAWLVGTTDRFTAAVSQRGVYDLTGFYGSTDWAYKLVEGDFDATPPADADFLWERSPTGHAHEVATPTLLLHSEDDYRTPMATAELFYRLLRKQGVDTRLVRYPDEGHELSRSGQPGHVVDRIERIARWFDGYAASQEVPPALERDPGAGLTAASDRPAGGE